MNIQDLSLDAVYGSPRETLCISLDAVGNGRSVLEARGRDDFLLTRFASPSFDDMTAVELALRKANLFGPQRIPVAVGLHRSSLVLSVRFARAQATTGAVDIVRAELLRFSAALGTP